MQSKFLKGLVGIPSFLNHFNVGFIFQQTPHAMADERVPIHNQATNPGPTKRAADELPILQKYSWGPEKFSSGDVARREIVPINSIRCVRLFYKPGMH